MIELNTIYNEDCLETMARIDPESIDMILCDLPYGTTACSWDTIIPFEPLWSAYKRIIKPNGAIVLTASQPFTSKLIMSNLDMFKYDMVWDKHKTTGHLNAKKMPLRQHEDILVFSKSRLGNFIYNPIMKKGKHRTKGGGANNTTVYGKFNHKLTVNDVYYPRSIISCASSINIQLHPTQKPVELFEYLIRTYTNEGDLVLDNCAGSLTTALACIRTDRNWICIEKEKKYCDIGAERIKTELSQMRLF